MVEKAQLFVTCLVDTLYPQTGHAVVDILASVGIAIEFPPEQTCCGQPAYNAGFRDQARPVAEHTIRVFEKTEGPIIIPSGSCTAMIRHGYLELFKNDRRWLRRAQDLAERNYEFTEFMVDYLGITHLDSLFHGKIAYHASCHLLRDLGIDQQPRKLLENIPGAEVVDLPYADECCGFGGIFSTEHPEISSAILDRKIQNIESSGAPIIVSCDAGCITNINGGLHRKQKPQRVVHIAEILAQIEAAKTP